LAIIVGTQPGFPAPGVPTRPTSTSRPAITSGPSSARR
jgi:hypothetical protein